MIPDVCEQLKKPVYLLTSPGNQCHTCKEIMDKMAFDSYPTVDPKTVFYNKPISSSVVCMLITLKSQQKSALVPGEQTLIEDILKGDRHQFDILVTRYRNQVFRFLLKFIDDPVQAEDLAQETFIAAFQNLESFQGNAKFLTWLLGIARNKVINDINRAGKRRSKMISNQMLENHQSTEDTPLEYAEKKQRLSLLKKAIDQLEPDLKEVLVAVSMEGLSYDEVANMQDIPVGTVKSKLFRARMILRKSLNKKKMNISKKHGT